MRRFTFLSMLMLLGLLCACTATHKKVAELLESGEDAFYIGNYDKAIADYTEAIRIEPKNAEAYFRRGDTYYRKGDEWKGIDTCFSDPYDQAAIQLEPDNASAWGWRWRSFAYNIISNNDRAIADYSEAIRLNPKLAEAYYNRGYAYSKKGDHDRAIEDFNYMIKKRK
ncbi:MAG: tetratricopeptide repeat protein [Treponema sp.]|nr:tetratricopeptide repeat protein [Treponema sp.]